MSAIKLPKLSLPNLLWLAAYLATIGIVIAGLLEVRGRTIEALEGPEATAAWNAWRNEEQRSRKEGRTPVVRRTPAAAEPPALVLMRDSFAGVLAATLVFATFFFLFGMLLIRGLYRQTRARPEVLADNAPPPE